MATIIPISTAISLTLDAGTDGDRQIKKTVSLRNISDTASADTLMNAANALGGLLEFPVATVKKHSVSMLEAE